MEKKGLQFYHGILAFAFAMLILLFGGYVLIPLFGKVGSLLAGLVIALVGVAFTALTKARFSDVFPHEAPPIRCFVGGLLMYIAVLMLNGIYSFAVSPFVDTAARHNSINSILLDLNPAVAIVLVAVLPAICEEFFCRGFLSHCFRGLKKDWLIIFLTGLAFGVMHLDLYTLFPSTVIGLLLGYLAIKTHSLVIPMLLHFINNSFTVVFAFVGASESTSEEAGDFLETLNLGQIVGMLVFYLGVGALCLYGGYRLFHRKRFFAKYGVLVLVLTLVLTVGGCGVMTIASIDVVCKESETVMYEEALSITIPMVLEEGDYNFMVSASADDPIEIVLLRVDGDKESVVKTTAFKKSPSLNDMLTLAAGEYDLVIRTMPNDETVGGSASYQAVVFRLAIGG